MIDYALARLKFNVSKVHWILQGLCCKGINASYVKDLYLDYIRNERKLFDLIIDKKNCNIELFDNQELINFSTVCTRFDERPNSYEIFGLQNNETKYTYLYCISCYSKIFIDYPYEINKAYAKVYKYVIDIALGISADKLLQKYEGVLSKLDCNSHDIRIILDYLLPFISHCILRNYYNYDYDNIGKFILYIKKLELLPEAEKDKLNKIYNKLI